ncbi:sugar ABC transporter ATP-binding protein [Anaerocellum diazotrophicum]|uniref:Ribose import ATP-binding protein RbsA n=1 Tax=Caldicellulosiruptor diazotrophicus TaxID=2806205 RepID=A0ABN6E4U2_9FIRM|nr:sugar ABC transporter ATP-binding protein [Caldicellulosiruptor diazotrophicus]BCS80382.1 ribose import ATP-binding protein RbsA [Caldicellulosiruptor diazotrophicus]
MKSSTDNELLRLHGITKIFPGTVALSDVSFAVNKAEIHAIVGENGAGKSTLMNIISGSLIPDKGEIYLEGRKVNIKSPRDAQNLGISIVHQELALCPHLTVAENIYIGRLPKNSAKIVDFKKLNQMSQEVLSLFDEVNIKPNDKVANLNVAQQQIVEIAKAITFNCKLLILDEPTSALSEADAAVLFKIIKDLKAKGISILYISHRLREIFELADRITVLRDGRYITTLNAAETNPDQVVSLMVGREIKEMYPPKAEKIGKEIFKVENINSDKVYNVSFSLREGEILGFAGLVGSGRTELAQTICGILPRNSGEIYLDGKRIEINSFEDAIKQKIGYVTEDRKQYGLFLKLPVAYNVSAIHLKHDYKRLLIDKNHELSLADEYVKKLNVKTSSYLQLVMSLSGGNQQKVMIAKWLAIHPRILILDEPTRGIDVGAKAEIHNLLRELAKSGIGIILISSELPEIIGMCDRVLVMREGRITGELAGEKITEENIMQLAAHK